MTKKTVEKNLSAKTVEKLRQMVRVLKKTKPDNFNMAMFASVKIEFPDDLDLAGRLPDILDKLPEIKVPQPICKTVACACGSAALDPWFRKKGFRLEQDNACGDKAEYNITYKNLAGFDAAEKFFKINYDRVVWLFDPGSYVEYDDVSLKTVIKRIETFIKDDGVLP